MKYWILESMGISLILTILLEELFAIVYGVRNKKDLLLICLVNILTNPAVVLCYYLLMNYTPFYSGIIILVLEALVILVEYYYYKTYGKGIRHPLQFAAYINLFSYGVGKILNLIL